MLDRYLVHSDAVRIEVRGRINMSAILTDSRNEHRVKAALLDCIRLVSDRVSRSRNRHLAEARPDRRIDADRLRKINPFLVLHDGKRLVQRDSSVGSEGRRCQDHCSGEDKQAKRTDNLILPNTILSAAPLI